MNTSPPRLRSDLECRAHGAALVVKDPVSGGYFRLREVERFIVEQLDGETPLDVIRRRAETAFAAGLQADHLAEFIHTLDRNGLLATAGSGRSSRPGRLSGNLLCLRMRLFDPHRLIERLVAPVSFAFTPAFVAASSAVIAGGIAVAALNAGALVRDSTRLWDPSTLPLLAAVLFSVASAHVTRTRPPLPRACWYRRRRSGSPWMSAHASTGSPVRALASRYISTSTPRAYGYRTRVGE